MVAAADGVDIFADIRIHADRPGGKYLHENIVLAAVEEILSGQGLSASPVSYVGALMTSLTAQSGTEPAVYAGVLTLLDRALASVPRALLISKAPRISAALVAVANDNAEQPPVLRGALSCVLRLLGAQPAGSAATPDAVKLFRWLLEFVVHPNPKVRARGQQACLSALEQMPSLSSTAAQFVERRLAAAALKDVQPVLYVLNFLRAALASFEAKPLSAATSAILRLPSLGHPLLSRTASEVLADVCSASSASEPLPSAALGSVIDALIARPATSATHTNKPTADSLRSVDAGALRASAAAAASLYDSDVKACHARLPALCTAIIRAMWRQQVEGAGTSGGGSKSAAAATAAATAEGGVAHDGPLAAADLTELLEACVRPSMAAEAVVALSAALTEALGPRYAPLREPILEVPAAPFLATTPACATPFWGEGEPPEQGPRSHLGGGAQRRRRRLPPLAPPRPPHPTSRTLPTSPRLVPGHVVCMCMNACPVPVPIMPTSPRLMRVPAALCPGRRARRSTAASARPPARDATGCSRRWPGCTRT